MHRDNTRRHLFEQYKQQQSSSSNYSNPLTQKLTPQETRKPRTLGSGERTSIHSAKEQQQQKKTWELVQIQHLKHCSSSTLISSSAAPRLCKHCFIASIAFKAFHPCLSPSYPTCDCIYCFISSPLNYDFGHLVEHETMETTRQCVFCGQ